MIGFNASEMLTFEGGVGYESYEVDVNSAPTETLMQYYLNATINIAPGFFIVPEVGYVTYDPDVDGAPEPERTLLWCQMADQLLMPLCGLLRSLSQIKTRGLGPGFFF